MQRCGAVGWWIPSNRFKSDQIRSNRLGCERKQKETGRKRWGAIERGKYGARSDCKRFSDCWTRLTTGPLLGCWHEFNINLYSGWIEPVFVYSTRLRFANCMGNRSVWSILTRVKWNMCAARWGGHTGTDKKATDRLQIGRNPARSSARCWLDTRRRRHRVAGRIWFAGSNPRIDCGDPADDRAFLPSPPRPRASAAPRRTAGLTCKWTCPSSGYANRAVSSRKPVCKFQHYVIESLVHWALCLTHWHTLTHTDTQWLPIDWNLWLAENCAINAAIGTVTYWFINLNVAVLAHNSSTRSLIDF